MGTRRAAWFVGFGLLVLACGSSATSGADVGPSDLSADEAGGDLVKPLADIRFGDLAEDAAGRPEAPDAPLADRLEPAPEPEPEPEHEVQETAPEGITDGSVEADTAPPPVCLTDADCADAFACTTDRCQVNPDGVAACVHVPVDCDDGDTCTADACRSETGLCQHVALPTAALDDGNACTTDYCSPLDGVHHDPITDVDCDDHDPCTTDNCDPADGCANVHDCELCPANPGCGCLDDAACLPATLCLQGACVSLGGANTCVYSAVVCPPEPCLQAVCDPYVGCVYAPVDPDDGDPCTVDTCDPVTGDVTYTDRDCADPDPCTDDACDAATGICVHSLHACDDHDACTRDGCDPEDDDDDPCTHTAEPCDDGNGCTLDTCTRDDGCRHTFTCDDGDPCTADLCESAACVHVGKPVTDDDACTIDACDPLTGVVSHAPVVVDDGNCCTVDTCDPATGQVIHDEAMGCDDGDPCTVDTCDPVTCVRLHAPVAVDDGDLCTSDGCSTKKGVFHLPVVCSPPTLCYATWCDPAVGCVPPVKKDCDDGLACTVDTCEPATGACRHTNIPCDDMNACTVDTCVEPTGCAHAAKDCNDNNLCTLDSCHWQLGCLHTAIDFDDGNPCTDDECLPAQGVSHQVRVCDDGNVCTVDTCDLLTGGCYFDPISIDDGDACTTDRCDPLLGASHVALDCTDVFETESGDVRPDLCTADSCNPATGQCEHVAECDGPNETCDPATGECTFAPECPDGCDDGNVCTLDTCDPQKGCVNTLRPMGCCDCCSNPACDPITGEYTFTCGCFQEVTNIFTGQCYARDIDCNDGDPCTVDTCAPSSGACVNMPKICNDLSACTVDSCDPLTGKCTFDAIDCDDDNACTVDTCDAGQGCTHGPVDCHDGLSCTTDTCDPVLGCQHLLKTCGREPCYEEVCFETTGVCTYRPIDCDDGNPCTDDVCDQSSGNCVFLPKYCSDGNRCTTDTCDTVTGACQYHPVDCDDGDACTTDTCAPLAGCQHTSIAGCSPQVEWVDVPAGSFQMGADGWETDEQPVHGVTVPAFRMARTETTVAQYARCVEAGGCTVPVPKTPYVPYLCTYGVPGFERRPVNCLDWVQASAFCGWAGGRLPTEAEWEYAARGGTSGDTYGPLDDIAAWGGIALSPDGPWIVASRQPNAFGIYDTVGNLMEYVADCWHSSYASAPSDGGAWIEGCTKLPVVKVIRDRAWSVESALAMRVSTRTDVNEGDTSDVYGFRCAADAPTP